MENHTVIGKYIITQGKLCFVCSQCTQASAPLHAPEWEHIPKPFRGSPHDLEQGEEALSLVPHAYPHPDPCGSHALRDARFSPLS